MRKIKTTEYNFNTHKPSYSVKSAIINSFYAIKAVAQTWWSGLFVEVEKSSISYTESTLNQAFATIRLDTESYFARIEKEGLESAARLKASPYSTSIHITDSGEYFSILTSDNKFCHSLEDSSTTELGVTKYLVDDHVPVIFI